MMYFLRALLWSVMLLTSYNHAVLTKQCVISVHEHELKPDVDVQAYEQEVSDALRQLKVPGLLQACLLKGFKGRRVTGYAVLWIWESEDAIKCNFGTVENPKWPKDWLVYENEVLAKYLICHPDAINFTAYNVFNVVRYGLD